MTKPNLGVVIVTYNAAGEIAACLESLMAAREAVAGNLHVVVVDNASSDNTLAVIESWADGSQAFVPPPALPFDLAPQPKPVSLHRGGPDLAPDPAAQVTLIQGGANRGFAGGVNLGLAHLAKLPEIEHFWVLNPDSMAPASSVQKLQDYLAQSPVYAILGGRVAYLEKPTQIQIDGGRLNRWTGVSSNVNITARNPETPAPDPATLDFITGASMVASRAFYDQAGPMTEDYFLYYEEVDWALRRGDLPLDYCPGFTVYHWGGTAIGSPVPGRGASCFSLYFKHRARMRFLRRFNPWAMPVGLAYSGAQALRQLLAREPQAAWTILTAALGGPVPGQVRNALDPDAAGFAFTRLSSERGPRTKAFHDPVSRHRS
ncbi:MAG: glycosyltransferase family 2 protein [Mangrovicoccus sp.]|nr:glycosyltransferase family 2 protein [Mangrovicoccus sp.]